MQWIMYGNIALCEQRLSRGLFMYDPLLLGQCLGNLEVGFQLLYMPVLLLLLLL